LSGTIDDLSSIGDRGSAANEQSSSRGSVLLDKIVFKEPDRFTNIVDSVSLASIGLERVTSLVELPGDYFSRVVSYCHSYVGGNETDAKKLLRILIGNKKNADTLCHHWKVGVLETNLERDLYTPLMVYNFAYIDKSRPSEFDHPGFFGDLSEYFKSRNYIDFK